MPLWGIKENDKKKLGKIAIINAGLHFKKEVRLLKRSRSSDELDVIVNQNKETKEQCLDQNQESDEQLDDESEEQPSCISKELNENEN